MSNEKIPVHGEQGTNTNMSNQLDISNMTDFELAQIVCSRWGMRKINGELYGFNQKCFIPIVDRKQLNQMVLGTFWNEQKQIRSTRKVKAIADAIDMLGFVDGPEDDEYLGFENGVLNVKDWIFYEGFSGLNSFPAITYNLSASYDFTMHDDLSRAGNPFITIEELRAISSRFKPTPNADRFFRDIASNDLDLVQRIYEMIGYILVPDTTAKSFFLLQGAPNSGKSVLGRFIEEFFPKRCVTALDISRLRGPYLPKSLATSRLNLSMDLPDGILPSKAVAMLKMMTGDDLVTLESKYEDAKPYRGQCKFLFSINGKLKIYGRDTAFLDRIVCIPFKQSKPMLERNQDLRKRLSEEREAIMMKALFYYRIFVRRNRVFWGSGKCLPDFEIRLSENETIQEFVNEECFFTSGMGSYTEDLYSKYLIFCTENSLKPVRTKSGFAQRLAGLFPSQIRPTRWREDGKNIRGFDGIMMKSSPEYYYNDADSNNGDEYSEDFDQD